MNIADINQARARIVKAACDMLAGELSFIEGARTVWRLGTDAQLSEDDPDLRTFLAIDSETDALPMGDVQAQWAPEAIERLRPQIERAEEWARTVGTAACQSLLKRFSSDQEDHIARN